MATSDSKLCRRCDRVKPLAEFHRNARRSDGVSVYCGVCMREYRIEKQYDKARWSQHREVESDRSRRYREANAESLRQKWRVNADLKRARDPGKTRAFNLARKYSEKRATPPWADMEAVSAFYKEAKRLEALDGIVRHVDHIVPIRHPLVCGLHVENNLQILTAEENMRKHNRFEV